MAFNSVPLESAVLVHSLGVYHYLTTMNVFIYKTMHVNLTAFALSLFSHLAREIKETTIHLLSSM